MKMRNFFFHNDVCHLKSNDIPITVTCMRYSKENASVPIHSHKISELVFIAKGSIIHCHDNISEKLRAGEFLIVQPGKKHAYRNASKDILLYNVLFNPEVPIPALISAKMAILAELYPNPDGCKPPPCVLGRMNRRATGNTARMLELLQTDVLRGSRVNTLSASHLFAAVIAELSAAYLPPKISTNASSLFGVCSYINANLSKTLSVKHLSQIAGTSPRTLQRLFKSIFGTAPGEYIRNMRIARAENMLKSTNQKIAAIAVNCGLQDASHLSKLFKKMRGNSPGSIRKPPK
jgi:AraC-like DNA-binding protein